MRSLGGILAALTIALVAACGDDAPERVDGQGYSYAVPDGWDQVEDDVEIAGFRPDSAVIGDRDDGFRVNVNVVREGGLPAGMTVAQYAEASIAGVRDPRAAGLPQELVDTVERMRPRQFTQPSTAEIGGEKAVTWEYVGTQGANDLHLRQVAAVMDGVAYTVTLSALPEQVDEGQDALDEVVDSWEWE
jgi:hypothetical protein